MAPRLFPNLFIVGAMKAGTSSLHEYLHQHPDIFMSRFKEPQYFSPFRTHDGRMWGQGNPHPEPGIDWYLRLFKDAGNVRYAGESSTNYTKEPAIVGCATRIYDFNPKARIIYILRDPVARTLSHYWYRVANKDETRPLARAIAEDIDYTAFSHYHRQVTSYWQCFGVDNVYLLTFEDLLRAPHETMKKLFRWLDLDADVALGTLPHLNETPKVLHRLRPQLWWAIHLKRHWRWEQVSRRIPSVASQVALRIACIAEDRKSPAHNPTISRLSDMFAPQIEDLSRETGLSFPLWKSGQSDSLHREQLNSAIA